MSAPHRVPAKGFPAPAPPGVRAACRRELLRWFQRHRRPLPWRQNRTPYRVWVSELMLQQTRVEQAAPYFRRFIRAFPSLRALAAARRHDVLKTWEGMGYYARARRAHDTARWLVRHNGGRFPRTYEGLLALPGIGPYTAAAMGSLAMGLHRAVVDGNVARVLARIMGYPGEPQSAAGKKQLLAWATSLLPPGRAGEMNEALMELGALTCLPRGPCCRSCPLRTVCRAFASGDPERYPARRRPRPLPHKVVGAGLVVNGKGEVLIAQRRETSMLGGLWEFPGGTRENRETIRDCIARELHEELGIRTQVGDRLITVKHTYSHFRMDLHAHWARIVGGRPRAIHCAAYAWASIDALRTYPFSRADLHIISALEKTGVPGKDGPARSFPS